MSNKLVAYFSASGVTAKLAELEKWAGDKRVWLSWKLDGLTVVLTYEDGRLTEALTRGNGEIGEVVTENAKFFKNVPLKNTRLLILKIRE